jgi:YVTN family beta-propeller protein
MSARRYRTILASGVALILVASVAAIAPTASAVDPSPYSVAGYLTGVDGPDGPTSVAVSGASSTLGKIYVTSWNNNKLAEYAAGSISGNPAASPNTYSGSSPNYQGALSPRSVAVNSLGTVFVSSGNSVTTPQVAIMSGSPLALSGTIVIGGDPRGLAVSTTTNDLFVADMASNSVKVIVPGSTSIATSIVVGSAPMGVTAGPGGLIFVTNYSGNSVSVIDSATRTVLRTVPVGSRPRQIAVTPDGTAYVTNFFDSSVSVIPPGSSSAAYTVPVAAQPNGIGASPNGLVLVSHVSTGLVTVLSPGAGCSGPSVVATMNVGAQDSTGDIAFAADGTGYVQWTAFSGSAQHKVSVLQPDKPTFLASCPPSSLQAWSPWSYSYSAVGGSASTYSVASGSLPPGVTLDSSTGLLSGKITAVGNYTFTIRATNTQGSTDAPARTISVWEPAPAPGPTPTPTSTPTPSPSATVTTPALSEPVTVPAEVPRGRGELIIDGQSVPVTITPSATGSTVVVSGGGVSLTLGTLGPGGKPLPLGPGNTLQLTYPGTTQVAASGFAPGSTVQLVIYSTPVELARLTSNAAGAVSASPSVPPGLTPGDHTLQFAGFSASGEPLTLSIGVRVTSPAAARGAAPKIAVTPKKVSASSPMEITVTGAQARCPVRLWSKGSTVKVTTDAGGRAQGVLAAPSRPGTWSVVATVGGRGCPEAVASTKVAVTGARR